MDQELTEKIKHMVNNGKVKLDKETGAMAFAFDTEDLEKEIDKIIQERVKQALANISRR